MPTENTLEQIEAGAAIILTTTSADKKAEYRQIFSKYNVNLFFSDEFGLSPQKTDEMTGSYDDNLLQKSAQTSKMLHNNLAHIENILIERGVFTMEQLDTAKTQGKNLILGAAEDSGISFNFHDKSKQDQFLELLSSKIKQKINPTADETSDLTAFFDEIVGVGAAKKIATKFSNNNAWLFDLENATNFPAANYKPIFEHLQGGVKEFFEIVLDAADEVNCDVATQNNSRLVRYSNNATMNIFPPSEQPQNILSKDNIISAETNGSLVSRAELDAIYEKSANKSSNDVRDANFSVPFTSFFLIPDGQKSVPTQYLSQDALLRAGSLFGKNGDVAEDVRLKLVGELSEKHRIERNSASKWQNRDNLAVSIFGAEENNHASAMLKRAITSRNNVECSTPSTDFLHDANISYIPSCDAVVFFPTGNMLQDAQSLFAITTDKQTRPEDKQKTIIIINPQNEHGVGLIDSQLDIYKNLFFDGLKNGQSEINYVVDVKTGQEEAAIRQVEGILDDVANNKQYCLSNQSSLANPADNDNAASHELEAINPKQFSVFVGGGAANNYLGYKEIANAIGRKICKEDWVLVFGAGHLEGCMGATHTGYMEKYLEKQLGDEAKRNLIMNIIDDMIAENIVEKGLGEDLANNYRTEILNCMQYQNGIKYSLVNYEKLSLQAPEIAKALIDPTNEAHLETLGSLTAQRKIVGYSMNYLLQSEGTGEAPDGVYYQEAGNMQRRMEEMLKADVLTFTAGGQGTMQELVEAVILNMQLQREGKTVKDIIILNQPTRDALNNGAGDTVFKHSLNMIDAALASHDLSRDELGIKEVTSLTKFNNELDKSHERWNISQNISPSANSQTSVGLSYARA